MTHIDLSLSWQDTASAIILALENGTAEGKRLARAELRRMAEVADLAADLKSRLDDEGRTL